VADALASLERPCLKKAGSELLRRYAKEMAEKHLLKSKTAS
jgi:hypothetical protein